MYDIEGMKKAAQRNQERVREYVPEQYDLTTEESRAINDFVVGALGLLELYLQEGIKAEEVDEELALLFGTAFYMGKDHALNREEGGS